MPKVNACGSRRPLFQSEALAIGHPPQPVLPDLITPPIVSYARKCSQRYSDAPEPSSTQRVPKLSRRIAAAARLLCFVVIPWVA